MSPSRVKRSSELKLVLTSRGETQSEAAAWGKNEEKAGVEEIRTRATSDDGVEQEGACACVTRREVGWLQ